MKPHLEEMSRQINELVAKGEFRAANRLRAAMRAEGNIWYSRPNPKTYSLDGLPRLLLDYIEVEGPLYEQWPPKSHETIFFAGNTVDEDREYAQRIFTRLLPRAFRRPVASEEVQAIVEVVENQLEREESFKSAIRAGIVAMLCSPAFIYVAEPDTSERFRELNDFELASRLSYFLWSSMPDGELFRLAAKNKLREVTTLDSQIDRMLADAKSDALVQDFAAQWLRVEEFDRFEPDKLLYDEYYRTENFGLRDDMKSEPLHFFREVLDHNESVLNFLRSDWAMLNERLARHYAVAGVRGQAFRRVSVPPASHRGGLLTMAGFHKWGSDGDRTKPIERGKYILDVLFNDPPDPPPPNAGEVEPNVEGGKLTVRERLEAHQQIESCAVCHRKIDPYGLALENYNVIGKWRDKQDGERRNWGHAPRIDASGKLPNGREFASFSEFQEVMLEQRDRFLTGLAEKMFIYAIGRSVEPSDHATIAGLVTHMKANGETLGSLIKAIIHTQQFQSK